MKVVNVMKSWRVKCFDVGNVNVKKISIKIPVFKEWRFPAGDASAPLDSDRNT